jgi:hypothetical protein
LVDDTHLKEKALYVATHLGIASFSASSRWLDRFKEETQHCLQNRWEHKCWSVSCRRLEKLQTFARNWKL